MNAKRRITLREAVETLLPHAQKLFEVAGSIDGIVASRVNLDYDIGLANAALEEPDPKQMGD